MLRLIDDLRGAFARLAHDDLGTLMRGSQVLRTLFGGGKPCSDLARPLVHRPRIIGHTNFIVNQMSMMNTSICTISVRLIFTIGS